MRRGCGVEWLSCKCRHERSGWVQDDHMTELLVPKHDAQAQGLGLYPTCGLRPLNRACHVEPCAVVSRAIAPLSDPSCNVCSPGVDS
jgi:hypothetical protein